MEYSILLKPNETIYLGNIFNKNTILITKLAIIDNSDVSIILPNSISFPSDNKKNNIYLLLENSFIKSKELYLTNNSQSIQHNILISYKIIK